MSAWLFVPGDRPERFAKAAASGADAVICDLEDAVAPANKPAARAAVAGWLREHRAYVRVNAAGTPWHDRDVAALSGLPGLIGVMLPQAETPVEIRALGDGVPVVPLVETAAGVENVAALATVPGVQRLAFGSIDFALDCGMDELDETLLYARSRLVLASRAARIAAPLDGVTAELDDPQETARDARWSRRLGFGGKLCIHPRQVALVTAAFTPSEEEIAWARAVRDAVAGSDGVARVRGEMVDRPVLERAQRILAAAEEEQ